MDHDVQLHIDGRWRAAGDGRILAVRNPATEDVIGSVPVATSDDLDEALAAAERGFATWRRVSAHDRAKVMRKAADLLRERSADIGRLMTLEQGKPLAQAIGETRGGADSPRLQITHRVIRDESCWPAHLGHDLVASVDTERALDTFQLRPVADIDPRRTYGHALAAVDTVPAPLPGLTRLMGTMRLATPGAIGNQQRIPIEHGALDARPRAHVGAHLLAHEAREGERGGGEDADGDVGDRRCLTGKEVDEQRRRVGEVEDPGAAGADRDNEPQHVDH